MLVLHSTRHVIKPIKTIEFSWAFVIRELSPGTSKLLIRARANYTPRRALPFVEFVIGPADFLNAGAMLRGIKRRVENAKARAVPRETGEHRPHPRRATSLRSSSRQHLPHRLCPARLSHLRLIQVGYGRAGFYSHDLFVNAGRPSADQILPEHQHPWIGEWVSMAANVSETTAFKIKAFEPNRFLLWEKPHSTWAWNLEPITGGRTRLITRLKARHSWRANPSRSAPTPITTGGSATTWSLRKPRRGKR